MFQYLAIRVVGNAEIIGQPGTFEIKYIEFFD